MQEIKTDSKFINIHPKYLWFLMLAYPMAISFANWFDWRLVSIFGIVTDAGTPIFTLTFLISCLITEVYGYKHARRVIWCGFLFDLFFVVYGQIIVHLPTPSIVVRLPNLDFLTSNTMFDTIMTFNSRIIIASSISYLCAEPLNSFIMAKMKIFTNGRVMWGRFVFSSISSTALDSLFFSAMAFYGTMSNRNLIEFIIMMWSLKIIIVFIGLPFTISLANKLKKVESLDIYDKKTTFNIFKLETVYESASNEYGQH